MTQLAQAERRTTVLMSTLAAAAVSIAITTTGLFVVTQVGQPAAPGGGTAAGVTRDARLAQGLQAGQAWEAQRRQQSPFDIHRQSVLTQAGIEWQLRYEQTNPNR